MVVYDNGCNTDDFEMSYNVNGDKYSTSEIEEQRVISSYISENIESIEVILPYVNK